MDFIFNEEQRAISEAAAKVFEDLCTDDQIKDLGANPCKLHADLWSQLAESGMLGLVIDEQYEGMGLTLLELAGVLEQQGRHVAPVPLLSTLVESAMTLGDSNNEALKKELLPKVASGELKLSALRPYAGVQVADVLSADGKGDGWELNGRSGLSLYAAQADGFVVDAGDAMLYVSKASSDITVTPQIAVSGEPAGFVSFTNCQVPAAQVIAMGDQAARLRVVQKQRAWIALSAIQTGVLDEGLKRAAAYVSERKQFGRPLGKFQAVSQQAANAYMQIEALRGAYWRALDFLEQGEDFGQAAAVAKYWTADSGHKAAHTFLHLHGGIGQDLEYPVHRFFLWAKFCERYLGGVDDVVIGLGDNVIAEASAAI